MRSNVASFVILFVERSGSTHLSTLLASHPDVLALREELSVRQQRGEDAEAQLKWAKEFLTPPLLGRYAARGFKTKIVDIPDLDRFEDILQTCNGRIIQLRRRNTVKGAVSTINAARLHESTGNWNLLNDGDRQPPFEVDIAEMEGLMKEREAWDEELSSYVERVGLPTLPIWYEELLYDEERVLADVFAFLNVRPHELERKIYKHTSDDLSEVMVNFDDVRARYAGTKYEEMLLEGAQV